MNYLEITILVQTIGTVVAFLSSVAMAREAMSDSLLLAFVWCFLTWPIIIILAAADLITLAFKLKP